MDNNLNSDLIIKPNLIKRIITTILDYLVVFIFSYLYLIVFGEEQGNDKYTASGIMVLPLIALWFIYFVVVEAKDKGTLMYQLFKLKVVSEKRNKIGFTESFKRHLLDPIDICLYGIPAFIAIKYSSKHQRLGDMFARTIVVDTSDKEQYAEIKLFGKD